MDTPHALLLSIRDDILDDAPRLILADWIEEQGDSDRAEFIRAQCEIARLEFANNWNAARCTANNPQYPQLKQREQELLRQHQKAWLGALGLERGVFYRGFLHVSYELLQFQFERDSSERQAWALSHSIDLLKVRGLCLHGWGEIASRTVQSLATGWGLAQVQAFTFGDLLVDAAGLETLLASPWLSELRSLNLGGQFHVYPSPAPVRPPTIWPPTLVTELLTVLGNSPRAAQLHYLGLQTLEGLTLTGAQALLDSPHLSNQLLISAGGTLKHLPQKIRKQLAKRFHLNDPHGW